MSLDTLLEAAKYLDHIEKTDLSDCEKQEYITSDGFEDSEELILPSATYHLKVDPNLPISVQFHTYTSCSAGLQAMQPMANRSDGLNGLNISTKRNAHQNGGNAENSVHYNSNNNNNCYIRPAINTINKNNANNANAGIVNAVNNKNKDHSSYSRHREMHKTLEKNRRAHLRHCFEILKDELPPSEYNEKKSSHINIISCAIRYIQHLKRTEAELEHQTERLVRTKIRFQSQIAQMKEEFRDLNCKPGVEQLLHTIQMDNTDRNTRLVHNVLQYEPPIDEQSDEEVIIELENGEECYDDETTTTASECADDIRDNSSNPSKISGSLTNAIIYKCHA